MACSTSSICFVLTASLRSCFGSRCDRVQFDNLVLLDPAEIAKYRPIWWSAEFESVEALGSAPKKAPVSPGVRGRRPGTLLPNVETLSACPEASRGGVEYPLFERHAFVILNAR